MNSQPSKYQFISISQYNNISINLIVLFLKSQLLTQEDKMKTSKTKSQES